VLKNKIGVVTVTYNSGNVLDDFLDSILKQTHKNFILYVIDNDSQDDTSQKIHVCDDQRIVYLQNDGNFGVAKANNQGVELAVSDACDYILFLNNDTLFADDTFEKLLNGIQIHQADIVVPKMYYFDKKDSIWFAGGNFDHFFHCDVDHISFREKDVGLYDTPKKITYAPTCCMLITSEAMHDVGLMDEKYFVYEDDVDFCYRATLLKNKTMFYLPDFNFYHKVGGLTNKEGSSGMSDFSIQYATRNRVYRCKKFFSFRVILFLVKFLLRENLKIIKGVKYKRSWHSFFVLNQSFIKGLFY